MLVLSFWLPCSNMFQYMSCTKVNLESVTAGFISFSSVKDKKEKSIEEKNILEREGKNTRPKSLYVF